MDNPWNVKPDYEDYVIEGFNKSIDACGVIVAAFVHIGMRTIGLPFALLGWLFKEKP